MMLDEQRLCADSTGEHHQNRHDGNEHPTPPTDTAVPRLVRRSINSHRTLRRCCVAGFHLRLHLLPVLRLIIMRRHTARLSGRGCAAESTLLPVLSLIIMRRHTDRLSCLGCAAEGAKAGACERNPTTARTELPDLN